jgi:hypothetical protein
VCVCGLQVSLLDTHTHRHRHSFACVGDVYVYSSIFYFFCSSFFVSQLVRLLLRSSWAPPPQSAVYILRHINATMLGRPAQISKDIGTTVSLLVLV